MDEVEKNNNASSDAELAGKDSGNPSGNPSANSSAKPRPIAPDVGAHDASQEIEYPTSLDQSVNDPYGGGAFLGDVLKDGAVSTAGQTRAASDKSPLPSEDDVIDALRQVYDPELPVNIYDLGLIYKITVEDNGNLAIDMTLTTPNCPVAGTLPQMVADQAASVPGAGETVVKLTWEPPWDIGRMSEDARMALGFI